MARNVTITGTRSIDAAQQSLLGRLFEEYLRPFADPDAHFYVGGAVGIDTAALDWLAQHTQANLTVVVPCTVADQPAVAADSITRWSLRNRLAEIVELGADALDTLAYHARNRWMVDHSGFVIAFLSGEFLSGEQSTSGTWYTVGYASDQGKPRLLIPV